MLLSTCCGVQIMSHLLDRVHEHIQDYHQVRNATLVQDLTQPDTLSNTLQVTC